jgi:hypothetical protein
VKGMTGTTDRGGRSGQREREKRSTERERERLRERGCVGGEIKFNFPSNRFSTKTKKKRGKNKIK